MSAIQHPHGRGAILFITDHVPFPLADGGALRIFHIARQLGRRGFNCHVIAAEGDNERLAALGREGVFRTLESLAAPLERGNPFRHFRLTDRNFAKRAHPRHFEESMAVIRARVAESGIGTVFPTSVFVADYARNLPGMAKVIDACDSYTLMKELDFAVKPATTFGDRIKRRLTLARLRRNEGCLAEDFDSVVAISDKDRQALADLTRRDLRHKISVIGNGVSEHFLLPMAQPVANPKAVAFWGVLDFFPNESAVLHFNDQIFRPYLADAGITWDIIGPRASRSVRDLAGSHPNLRLRGFVDDLIESVSGIPIMVNPMLAGAGQKNKVLEAFALRKAVVSTTLGMQGIDGAEPGTHFLAADDPKAFAEAILALTNDPVRREEIGKRAHDFVLRNYSWDAVGARWAELFDSVGGGS